MTRAEAIGLMISAVNAGEPRQFTVGLVGYYIEGQLHSADVLQVDTGSTLNLRATEQGFCCYALFPPPKLTPEIVDANGIQTSPDGTDFVVVRLDVNEHDVWAVFETTRGIQHELFLDYAARETGVALMAERLHASHR
jgi:hypothetical protein